MLDILSDLVAVFERVVADFQNTLLGEQVTLLRVATSGVGGVIVREGSGGEKVEANCS